MANPKSTSKKSSKGGKASPVKMVYAKVKGEDLYLGHDGSEFTLTSNIDAATEFSEAYFKAIAKSKWGGKAWEQKPVK